MDNTYYYEKCSIGKQIVFGSSVLNNPVPNPCKDAILRYNGNIISGDNAELSIDKNVFSRHILLLGASGSGKSNVFYYTIEKLREQMQDNDIILIFDTKGDYYHRFHTDRDIVLGNSQEFRKISCTWNIFDDILADGDDPLNIRINAHEIASALFHGRGSMTQPFFCNAARDLFMGILLHYIRMAKIMPELWADRLNNRELIQGISQLKVEQYKKIFNYHKDLRFILSYFGDGKSNQALGVFGELYSMISEYFVGVFADHNSDNSISMRRLTRESHHNAIFIEYDMSVGQTLTPMYRLLVDLALKEMLGRGKTSCNRRLFLIADEFKLLPKLQHIDDALNFGRSQGVNIMAAIQSVDQLYDIYGKEKGSVIASGFGSLFAFRTNDATSREYISNRFGNNVIVNSYINRYNDTPYTLERNGKVVEDWEQLNLIVGQAIIGVGSDPPFIFRFRDYDKEKEML